MFASKVAKPQKTAGNAASKAQRSALAGHRLGRNPIEQPLFLQQTIGNQATLRLLAQRASSLIGSEFRGDHFSKFPSFPPDRLLGYQPSPTLATTPLLGAMQAKLVIGQPNDPLEHEADRVADQVMRMPDPAPLQFNRKYVPCGEQDVLHPKEATPHAAGGEVPALVHDVLRAPGKPLDPITRAFFEPRFGRDLGNVRVSADAAAARSAAVIGARAYTVGRRIAFAAGEYAPGTSSGLGLLAHELAHVVQQSDGVGGPATPAILQRSPSQYDSLTIDELRKLVSKGDKSAAEALYARYEGMTTAKLAQYARGSDDIARDVYARRTVPPKAAAGQGSFSIAGMQDLLAADISANRTTTGIRRGEPSAVTPDVEVKGGTVGAARTNIPGLDDRTFIGQSKLAGGPGYNPKSSFPPATNVESLRHTFGHAEQHIADQLEEALAKIPREQLKGRTVWILIEQEVCATCAQGAVNPDTAAGVLKKLSQKYPELTFEVKSLQSSALMVLKGASPAAGGAVSHVVSGGAAAKETAIVTTDVAQGVAQVATRTSRLSTAGRFLARETPGLILQGVLMLLFPPGVHMHNDKAQELSRMKLDPAVRDDFPKHEPVFDKLQADDPSKSIYANVTARLDYEVAASSSGDLELYLKDATFVEMKITNEYIVLSDPKFKTTSRNVTREVTYSFALYQPEGEADPLKLYQSEISPTMPGPDSLSLKGEHSRAGEPSIIQIKGRPQLALAQLWNNRWYFMRWISPQLRETALRVAGDQWKTAGVWFDPSIGDVKWSEKQQLPSLDADDVNKVPSS
jgi:hypothetical protein